MISAKEAYDIFKEAYPNLTVTECCLYDKNHFVFTAVEDPNKIDFNDPYYAVHRNSKRIFHFSPMEDLDAWLNAITKHQVDWR